MLAVVGCLLVVSCLLLLFVCGGAVGCCWLFVGCLVGCLVVGCLMLVGCWLFLVVCWWLVVCCSLLLVGGCC